MPRRSHKRSSTGTTTYPRERTRTPLTLTPSPLDKRRHLEHRSGVSPEELAARENVSLPTIHKSIERVNLYYAQYSQEAAEVATREVYMRQLSDAAQVFTRALNATRHEPHTQIVSKRDPITGEYFEEAVVVDKEVPDLNIQLKGMETLKSLLAGVQPRTPMVSVDARSQTNIGTPSTNQLGAGQPLPLSAEALIRRVRADAGLALPSSTDTDNNNAVAVAALAPLVERDMELEDEEEDEDEEVEEDGEDKNDSEESDTDGSLD